MSVCVNQVGGYPLISHTAYEDHSLSGLLLSWATRSSLEVMASMTAGSLESCSMSSGSPVMASITPGLPTMPAVKLGLDARESMISGLSAMAWMTLR